MMKKLTEYIGYEKILFLITFLIFAFHISNFTKHYFDEFHYVPASKDLVNNIASTNLEHPPLGKILIGASINFWGDNPIGWRFSSLLLGILSVMTVFKIGKFIFKDEQIAFLIGIISITNFWIFIQSRIAMLDIFLLFFLLTGIWSYLLSSQDNRKFYEYLCFVSFGLATAVKWNAIFIYLPTIVFFYYQKRMFLRTIKLILISMLVYYLCYIPIYTSTKLNYSIFSIIFELPFEMLKLQRSVTADHPYKSKWFTWPLMIRPIWYEYIRNATGDKFQGVVLLGNPIQMALGILTVFYLSFKLLIKKIESHQLYFLVLFLVSWLFWALIPRGLQFFYYFFFPACMYIFLIPLSLKSIFSEKNFKVSLVAVAILSIAFFIYFYPVISGDSALEANRLQWAWLRSWI